MYDGDVLSEPDSDETYRNAEVAALLESMKGLGDWEVAPHQPAKVLDSDLPNDDLGSTEAVTIEEAKALADDDLLWQTKDGSRYDALFVTSTGLVLGRRGPAPAFPEPNEENGFGASFGKAPGKGSFGDAMWGDDAAGASPAMGGNSPELAILDDTKPQAAYIGTDWWNDDRLRIVTGLTHWPFRLVGALSASGNVRSGSCSGAKIGPRAVLTASHCVLGANGSIRTSGFFNPGRNGDYALNGSIPWSGVFLRDWRLGRQYGYAVIFLHDSQETADLGWHGIVWYNSASGYSGKHTINRGYPCGPNMACGQISVQRCKYSPRVDKRCDGWMYQDSKSLVSYSYTNDGKLWFFEDVSKGHSGSPILSTAQNIYAVAAYCGEDIPYGPMCGGPRFRPSMWNDVCSWIAAVPSQYATHPICN